MRRTSLLSIAALLLSAVMLSGCIIEAPGHDGGWGHWHHWHEH